MVRGGLMLGLMEYVSPISPASRVWLGLPAGEAALILALQPADSRRRERLIRHTAAAEATLCLRCGGDGREEEKTLFGDSQAILNVARVISEKHFSADMPFCSGIFSYYIHKDGHMGYIWSSVHTWMSQSASSGSNTYQIFMCKTNEGQCLWKKLNENINNKK